MCSFYTLTDGVDHFVRNIIKTFFFRERDMKDDTFDILAILVVLTEL